MSWLVLPVAFDGYPVLANVVTGELVYEDGGYLRELPPCELKLRGEGREDGRRTPASVGR